VTGLNSTLQKQVKLKDLDESMVIVAYVGFNDKYKSLDDTTCKWLKLNFKECRTVVVREGETLNTPIEDIKPGDRLKRVQGFTSSLKKLTIVNERLKQELEKRGFLEFKIEQSNKTQNAEQIKRAKSVKQAEAFVQKVKDTEQAREGATNAVEDLIDKTRFGKTNISDVLNYVENIVKNSSAESIAVLTGLKESDQTYAHCVDVGGIFQTVYGRLLEKNKIKSVFKDNQEILLGAFLHDIGKAKVPKEILDSTVRFERDSPEMKQMQSHPTYGAEILTKMRMSEVIISMAHHHHVKMDAKMQSSYPRGVRFDSLPMETRLIAIIDVYQALVGRRSYKKSWAPPAAVKFIDQLSGIEYDPVVWEEFLQIMGTYPTGSLVELNDGSTAFVLHVNEEDLDNPRVAVVKNAKGEDLERHTLIDLQTEKDMSIVKGLDNFEVYGEACFQKFVSLQVV